MTILETLGGVLQANGLVTAFAFVGLVMWLAYKLSDVVTGGRIHGSALAILGGLVLAWVGGVATGGSNGLADIPVLAGVGVMGGGMLRDFTIVATAFGVNFDEIRKAGMGAVLSLFVGVLGSFVVGAGVAFAFGYTDAVSMTTIGAGAATYIVGPVTGAAVGASSDVIALSIAAGLVKSMLVMTGTPFVARAIGLGAHMLLGHGEQASGGGEKSSILSCAYEAVLGALFLDGGYEEALAFVRRWFEPLIERPHLELLATDAKSALQETLQEQYNEGPSYVLEEEIGPAHARTFTVSVRFRDETMGTGSASSKKEAEQRAAKAALDKLNALNH